MRFLSNILWLCVGLVLSIVIGIHYAKADTLPNAQLTPGVARDVDMQTLCTTSTKLVRHTSKATKTAVYKEYGITPRHAPECTGPDGACFEIDHLIALTDGGADVKENLWPQSYDGACSAHHKDDLEFRLHRLICNGTITMQEAQSALSSDWVVAYAQYIDSKGCGDD